MKNAKNPYRPYRTGKRAAQKATHASSVLAGALPNIAIGPRLNEFRIKQEWSLIVGKAIAARTCPGSLIKKTLYCVVSSSAWMTELSYQKPLIIEKINKVIGPGTLNEIVFKSGLLPKKRVPAEPIQPRRENALTKTFIEETTSNISDDSLKILIKRVMKKSPF